MMESAHCRNSGCYRRRSHLLLVERFRPGVMLTFDLRQVAQKLANRSVRHVADGALANAPPDEVRNVFVRLSAEPDDQAAQASDLN